MKIKFMRFIAIILNLFRISFVYGFTGTCDKCNTNFHIKYVFGKCMSSNSETTCIRLNDATKCPNCGKIILFIRLSKKSDIIYTYIK